MIKQQHDPRLTENLVFIIIWKHALNVTSFIFTIALAWNQKLRKKASIALLNRRISRVWFLFVQIFCSNFRLLKSKFSRSQSIEPAAKKKSKQGMAESTGSARYYYWFLLVFDSNSQLELSLSCWFTKMSILYTMRTCFLSNAWKFT